MTFRAAQVVVVPPEESSLPRRYRHQWRSTSWSPVTALKRVSTVRAITSSVRTTPLTAITTLGINRWITDLRQLGYANTTIAQRRLRKREEEQLEGGDVQRREFLGAMAVAGLAASWPSLALWTPGRRLGVSDVQRLIKGTARLRRLDDFLGGADTYRLYAHVLKETQALLRNSSCTSDTKRACTAVIAEQAQQAGWAAFDAGMHSEATAHHETSLQAAKEANDPALAGNALAFLAYQQVTFETPNVAMAKASYEIAEKNATPRVRAMLLERMAWTHAVAGQPKESERALATAAELVNMTDDRPEPDWVFWVDADEIKIMTGRCWTQLHRPLRAVPILEDVLGRYDDTHARDKAIYLTSLAHAYIDAREIEQGAIVTQQAVDLAMGVGSVRPAERMGKVVHRLKPHRALSHVSGVLEAAATLPTAR